MDIEKKFKYWDRDQEIMSEPRPVYNINFHPYEIHPWSSSITLLQFTGLHDCRGSEIYEGDIVEDIQVDAKNGFGVVTMNPFDWGTEPFIREDAFEYKGFIELVRRGRIAVIGNIFENPDLFEEKMNVYE